ncbi:MAG: DUF4870 domain-containing protein [Bacteroidota bacterium]
MSEYEALENDQNLPEVYSTQQHRPWGMDTKQFCMLIHLAQFAGYIVPFAGLILPIVMWTSNKDLNPEVDRHGKSIMNWIISLFIYSVVATVLTFVLIGIPLLLVLVVLSIIFPIMGAVKAGNGEHYEYPLTIKFFS